MAKKNTSSASRRKTRRWWLPAGLALIAVLAIGAWYVSSSRAEATREAPEAQRILDVQANLPFQIMIPAFLPKVFDRENVQIDITQSGPSGEPLVQLIYRTKKGDPLFIKEWVPVEEGVHCPRCDRELTREQRDPFSGRSRSRKKTGS